MFVSNIEALVTYNLNEELKTETLNTASKSKKYRQKVNKSVSFNTIKNYAFELFYLDSNVDKLLDFLQNSKIKALKLL